METFGLFDIVIHKAQAGNPNAIRMLVGEVLTATDYRGVSVNYFCSWLTEAGKLERAILSESELQKV